MGSCSEMLIYSSWLKPPAFWVTVAIMRVVSKELVHSDLWPLTLARHSPWYIFCSVDIFSFPSQWNRRVSLASLLEAIQGWEHSLVECQYVWSFYLWCCSRTCQRENPEVILCEPREMVVHCAFTLSSAFFPALTFTLNFSKSPFDSSTCLHSLSCWLSANNRRAGQWPTVENLRLIWRCTRHSFTAVRK